MAKPNILIVEGDPSIREVAERELDQRYAERFQILSSETGSSALDQLKEIKKRGEPVALLLANEQLPDMNGIDFLNQASELFRDSKRALISSAAEWSASRTDFPIRVDALLHYPFSSSFDRFESLLDDLLDDWLASSPEGFARRAGIRVLGHRWSPETHAIKDFFARCQVPIEWMDVENDAAARQLLQEVMPDRTGEQDTKRFPVVIFPDGSFISNPSDEQIAEKIGLSSRPKEPFYDLIIIGGGPAGLSAAVYAGSEGLRTVLIEKDVPGGQASMSARIENYLGFPSGISGSELAQRAVLQAQQFGVEILAPQTVTALEADGDYRFVHLSDGTVIVGHSVILAIGIEWRELDVPRIERFIGAGVYYGSTLSEAEACRDEDVYIIGGANSAGQAAIFFAKYARRVTILVRSQSLSKMSEYLLEEIEATPNISVKKNSRLVKVHGQEHLEAITIQDEETGERQEFPASSLFVFIGASPSTDWIKGMIDQDERGYILTGSDLTKDSDPSADRRRGHQPRMFETSVPGVFAIGDVRHGSVERVASAVGQGAVVIHQIHKYLKTL